jgi:hypothetical protein
LAAGRLNQSENDFGERLSHFALVLFLILILFRFLAAGAIPFFLTKKGEKVKEKRNAPPVFPGHPHIIFLRKSWIIFTGSGK